ncbi:MAG: helix-turn-helix domain-containing protein [Candidatus Omnitrophica bacterium]|nr:helix-turn-helix domain-containing protein [Candidatus Omnitrophota bacterium]
MNSIFKDFLKKRNQKIITLRKKGISLKELSKKFNLSIRHISRILKTS